MDQDVAVNPSRGRPPTDPAERERFRAELIRAAASLLAERGVQDVTVDDVAGRAGVSRATVYRHLGGRDEIVVAVALGRLDEWVEGLRPKLAGCPSASAVVIELFRSTLRSVGHDTELAALVGGGTVRRAGEVVADDPLAMRRLEAFRSLLDTALLPHRPQLRPGLDPAEVADHLLSALVDRLGAAHRGWPPAEVCRWVTTWVLPSLLEERPAVPGAELSVR